MTAHLIWALVVAGLVATNCATHARLESAQTTISTAKRDLKNQKDEAAQTLAEETGKKEAAEKELAAFKAELERKDATNKAIVVALAERLRVAGGPAGRLRDPNGASGCGQGGGGAAGATPAPASGGAADPAETGGLLSAPLTRLLRELQREADDINTAYAACRPDALKVRGIKETTAGEHHE